MSKIDAITRAVIVNNLQWATEEMNEYLARSAFSSNIKVRRDCSCAVYTRNGEMLAQGVFVPMHLGVMCNTLREVLKLYPPETLKEGDMLMHNDPYAMGSHIWDIMVFRPVFFENELIAFTGVLAHVVDVGGSPLAYVVPTMYEEGLRIPTVKLMREGVLQEDIVNIVATNVRTPYEVRGDLMAEIAANRRGEERLLALAEKYGKEDLMDCFEAILDYSEAGMRKGIAGLPDGTVSFKDVLESDGINRNPIDIQVNLTIKGEDVYADFNGSGPTGAGGLNNIWSTTLSGLYYGIKAVIGSEVPANGGAYRAVHVEHPDFDCILDAQPPHACGGCTTVGPQRVAEVTIAALAQLVPERCCACDAHWAAVTFGGFDEREGRYFSYVETYGAGRGAKHDQDGASGHHTHMTNTANAPTEIIELEHPFIIHKYGLVNNSGGAGQYRGGLGLERELECLTDMAVSALTSRNNSPIYGQQGGQPGGADGCQVTYPDGSVKYITSETVPKGSLVQVRTGGGGGWGDPALRDHAAIEWDVLNDFESVESAKEKYGVTIDPKTKKIV